MSVTLLYQFLYSKTDLNLLENRWRKFFFFRHLTCISFRSIDLYLLLLFFYVIHFCFTSTKVYHNAEITTALVWLLRAVPVSVMPRCRDTYSGSSCANGQGWNGAANGPDASWTEQHGKTQRHAVFSCPTGGSHPTLTTAVHWLHGGIQGILFFFLLESSLWDHCLSATAGLEADPILVTGVVLSLCYPTWHCLCGSARCVS